MPAQARRGRCASIPRRMQKTPAADPPVSHREWSEHIYRAITEMSIRQIAYVPDAGHKR